MEAAWVLMKLLVHAVWCQHVVVWAQGRAVNVTVIETGTRDKLAER